MFHSDLRDRRRPKRISRSSAIGINAEFLIRIALIILLIEYSEAAQFSVFEPSMKQNTGSE